MGNRQTLLNNSAGLSVVKRSCLEFIAMGQKLCLSSVVLVFRVRYALWEGRGVNGLFPEWVDSVAAWLPFFWIWLAYTESRFWRGWPTICGSSSVNQSSSPGEMYSRPRSGQLCCEYPGTWCCSPAGPAVVTMTSLVLMVFRTRLLGSDAGPPLFSGSGHYLI